MQLDAVALMLPAIDNEGLEVYALDFPDSKGAIRPGAIVSPDGLPTKVFRTGKLWVGDISEERQQYFDRNLATQEGLHATCFLPLTPFTCVRGVLRVARHPEDACTDHYGDFLLKIAGQIAIAID